MAKAATLKARPSSTGKTKALAASPFQLTPELRELRARLRKLHDAAYTPKDSPGENGSRRAWKEWRARQDARRSEFELAVANEMAKRCIGGNMFRPRKYRSPAQMLELAVLGEFRLEADRAVGSMIRRAAGLRY
jgi:hypothetical protein